MVRNFLFNYLGLFRALVSALTDGRSLHLLAMSASLVFVSTSFYVLVEGWSILDAAYFSVITMSTVGYGDIAPTTTVGKVITMIFTVAGIGIFCCDDNDGRLDFCGELQSPKIASTFLALICPQRVGPR